MVVSFYDVMMDGMARAIGCADTPSVLALARVTTRAYSSLARLLPAAIRLAKKLLRIIR